MSETTSLTIELPPDILESLESLAERTGRDVAVLASEAVMGYIALQQRHMAAVDEALAQADADAARYAHADVMAWLESWETPDELPPPNPM
jgi:predicted transcriptional regulator